MNFPARKKWVPFITKRKGGKDAWAEELGSTGWQFPMGSRERCGGGKWVSGRGDCHQSGTSEM